MVTDCRILRFYVFYLHPYNGQTIICVQSCRPKCCCHGCRYSRAMHNLSKYPKPVVPSSSHNAESEENHIDSPHQIWSLQIPHTSGRFEFFESILYYCSENTSNYTNDFHHWPIKRGELQLTWSEWLAEQLSRVSTYLLRHHVLLSMSSDRDLYWWMTVTWVTG